jgi:tetratricopeptide (TPR) repeat protein
MRTILLVLIGGFVTAQAQDASPARQAEAFYQKGVIAEKAGDPVTARSSYMQALKLNPNHPDARFKVGELQRTSGSISAKGREAKFGKAVIPKIILEEAPLSEALQALGMAMEKAAPGEPAPTFIVEDPAKALDSVRISLQLKGVPAKGVLDYILAQGGAKARYDEHAIVILKR